MSIKFYEDQSQFLDALKYFRIPTDYSMTLNEYQNIISNAKNQLNSGLITISDVLGQLVNYSYKIGYIKGYKHYKNEGKLPVEDIEVFGLNCLSETVDVDGQIEVLEGLGIIYE